MKYCLVFLFSFTLILSASAQKTIIISLDFAEKKFENLNMLEELTRGDFYQLKIKNINLNLYDVSIEYKDSTINSNVEFPAFDLINIDNLSKLIDKLSPLSTYSETRIVRTKKDTVDIVAKNKLIERMNNELKFLLKTESRIYMKNLSLDSLKLSLNKRALSYYVEKTNSDYFNYLRDQINIESAFKKVEELRTEIKDISHELKEAYLSYEIYISDNKSVIESDTELNKRNNELNEAFSSANQNITLLYSSVDAEKVYTWFNALTILENCSSGEFVSLPMQKEGDITNLKINVVPKKPEYGLSSYKSNLQFPTNTKKYLGIGMGYYISTMHDEAFSINSTQIDTVTTYNVIDENTPHSEIGFATLLYYGARFNNSGFGFHFTIGPAFSISNKIKPRLTSGLGFSFGKKQMISFDLLLIAGNVDRLSAVYPVKGVFSAKPDNVVVSKLQYGGAISFGYIYKF